MFMDRNSSRQELWRRRKELEKTRCLVFFLLLFIAAVPVSGQAPTITVPPMDQDVLLGGEFSMTCSAEGNGSVSIRWEKDGILLSNGAVMGNSLVYDEALASHAGSYVCVASNDEGETRAEATVTIFYAPVFLSLGVWPGEEVVNGSMVTLTCEMDGFPTPNITWLHNGMEVVGSETVTVSANGVLTVAEVRLSDAGLYTCNSSNEFGSADADYDILLLVYYPPMDIVVQGSPPELEPRLGERAELTCMAFSMPSSTYIWWKDGGDGEEQMVKDTTSIMTFDGNGTLLFVMVQREDAGNYFCNASNGYGSLVSQHLTLRVSAVPLPPIGVRLTSLTSFSATIHWDHISSSYPPVHTYHVEYRLSLDSRRWLEHDVPSNPNSHTITGLLPYACYLVRVSATNPVGRGDPSAILNIMTDTGVPRVHNTVQDESLSHYSPRSVLVEWTIHPDILSTSYASTWINVSSEASGEVPKEVTGSPAEVNGLEPNTHYSISLNIKFEGGGQGPPVLLQTTTPEDAPSSPPTNLEVSMVTATTAHLSWQPPLCPNGDITSYNISYWPTGDSLNVEELEVGGNEHSKLITGLRPFTNYTVSVLASTAVGEGPANTTEFTTDEAAPQSPTIVESYAISSTAVWLSWELDGRVPGVLSGYNVTYSSTRTPTMRGMKELTPSNASVVLEQLEVWTEYKVCVMAATARGGPGNPTCISLRTLSAVPEVQVKNVSLYPLCPPSLTVVWEPVDSSDLNGPPQDTDFVIFWKEKEGEGNDTVRVAYSNSTTEGLVPGLKLDTQYSVSVAVANSNGSGPASVAVEAKTPIPGAPAVRMLNLSSDQNSLLVSWQPPLSPSFQSLNFSLSISPAHRENLFTTDFSFNITGLTPGTMYDVTVTADGGCGMGDPATMTTTTQEAPPGPPVISIATVSAYSVAIQLKEPVMPNGVITGFMVKCGASEPVSVMKSYHICSGLEADTAISVSVTAVNGAGQGDVATINTFTACRSEELKVETSSELPTVKISEGCSSEAGVLVVVQEAGGQPRPLGSYSVEELVELTLEYSKGLQKRQAGQTTVYIAANISRDMRAQFDVGDGERYGDYTNHPLQPGTKYRLGVVGVSDNTSHPDTIVTSQDFTTAKSEGVSGNGGGAEFSLELATAVGASLVAVLLLTITIIIVIGTLLCCYRSRRGTLSLDMQGKGSTHSFERSASVRISGRRGNKPADPVEEYRANYHTEALEAHLPVPVNGFVNKLLVMKTNDNQLFLEEFGSIEMNPQQPCSVAELPVNRGKNRYHNILPYDHSRVKLSHGKGHGDYINASYCSGFMKVQGFIATQGPLPETVPDFWRLVWEQNARTVVMLTNAQERLKTKCEVYWPREVGCSVVYGSIEVTLTDFTQLADYTIRSLTISKAGSGKEGREVKQFHFTSWPDHGVPQFATAMLAMVRRVMAFHSSETGPMVVHCSAGVGRTGTFIVIYSMIERMKANRRTVDIYGHVSLLRTQRNYMVQTEDQYFFIYEAVAETIVCGDTEVTLDQLEEYVSDILAVPLDQSEHTLIEIEFKRLAVDKSDTYRFSSANKDVNKAKNRYVNVLPYENRRVILQYQRAQEGSDYINASFIDGYHYRNAFIATQGPLQNTLADFWRMVWEHNVPVIVMLTKCKEKGTERSAQYWPQDIGQTLTCGLYSVGMTLERKSEHYTYRDLVLVDTQTGRKRQVRHFHYLSWPEVGVPSSSVVLLDFLREIQKNFATLNTKSPITVHCSNGIGRTGVFIALHILLERMVTEGLVDVFQTIKNLRIQRPAMVQTLEQYQFCYTAALDYLETSDLANQLHSSTRSEPHSLRAASNASELRLSRRSLNRNDSLRSSAKRSSRNLEMAQVGNGVSTTVYGDSEATSTFSSTQHNLSVATWASQEDPAQRTPSGAEGGSSTSPLPPSSSSTPQLLPNLSQSSQDHPTPPPSALLHSNTLPSRGGSSNLLQSHMATGPTSASQSSLGHSGVGVGYPVSSFRGRDSGGQRSSQNSLEREIAALTMNINNSNNNDASRVVNVYIEP